MLTLKALCETLIPADDFPDGWEAGAGDYILDVLASGDGTPFHAHYEQGLTLLDTEAVAQFKHPFAQLNPHEREALLNSIETGQTRTPWTNPAQTLTVWCNHVAEGYYNNPNYGGNRDFVSWTMIGFPTEASIHAY